MQPSERNAVTEATSTFWRRLVRAACLLLASAVLLTLSAAPFGQCYLAWAALAPWLVAAAEAPGVRAAMLRGVAGGVLYFAVNLWWLWTATIPGTMALVVYFSLYWGFAAALIRALGLLRPELRTDFDEYEEAAAPPQVSTLGSRIGAAGCTVGVAAVWVAFEWLRCNVVSGFHCLPLGVTQSPLLLMCQVADLGGPSIVSFWVALVNALAAVAWLHRDRVRSLAPAAGLTAATLALIAAYGAIRLATTNVSPGPRVLLVQSNFRHLPGGALTAAPEQVIDYLLGQLESQLAAAPADLAVLPEAALPPINAEARAELARAPIGAFLAGIHERLSSIAAQRQTALLVGGNAVTGWTSDGKARVGAEIRNAAYYFPPHPTLPEQRYDKSYLVPFSERAPFANGPAWLRRAALTIAAGRAAQPLVAGEMRDFQPFELSWQPAGDDDRRQTLEFIAPICLEAVDPRIVSQMMRRPSDSRKPIALIANLSNDGWFATQEKHQHLQSVVFRSIEHRVPLVRSSNTGISGWIDSTGRVRETIAANTSGAVTVQVDLDGRVTPYSQLGDAFAGACLTLTAMGAFVQAYLVSRVAGQRRKQSLAELA